MGRGDDEYDDYAPPYPESEAEAALSNSDPLEILRLGRRMQDCLQGQSGHNIAEEGVTQV